MDWMDAVEEVEAGWEGAIVNWEASIFAWSLVSVIVGVGVWSEMLQFVGGYILQGMISFFFVSNNLTFRCKTPD